MSRWVGIDPSATATGMAFNHEDDLWAHSKHAIESWLGIHNALAYWSEVHAATHLMIEGQFVGPNPKSALMLATVKGRIVQMAVELGYEIHEVQAKAWQKEILGVSGSANSAMRKVASVKYVQRLGVKTKDDNIADAICIAIYAERMFG